MISQAQDDLMKARCACIYPTAFHLMPECLGALIPGTVGTVLYHFAQYGNKLCIIESTATTTTVQFYTDPEVLSDFFGTIPCKRPHP